MKINIPTFAKLPKWVLYGVGVGLLVAVFAIGAFAAPYIQSPFKAAPSTDQVRQEVSEQDESQDEEGQAQEADEPKGLTSIVTGAFKRAVSSAPASQNTEVETNTKTTVPANTTLQIESVQSSVEENGAVVTWTTSLPAESRLIFDNGEGRAFESESGLSTTHKIHTTGLQESEEYDYKITAVTADKSQHDDHYGIIYAPKKYTAVLGEKDGECQIILVKDTAGKIAASKEVRLSPSHRTDNGTLVARGAVALETDSRGEIEYCEVANTYKLTGTELSATLSSL